MECHFFSWDLSWTQDAPLHWAGRFLYLLEPLGKPYFKALRYFFWCPSTQRTPLPKAVLLHLGLGPSSITGRKEAGSWLKWWWGRRRRESRLLGYCVTQRKRSVEPHQLFWWSKTSRRSWGGRWSSSRRDAFAQALQINCWPEESYSLVAVQSQWRMTLWPWLGGMPDSSVFQFFNNALSFLLNHAHWRVILSNHLIP